MAETKRVIYYDQLDNNRPTSGDVIFVDNPTTGTHKMDLKSFVDMINNGFDSSIKSSGVTVNADNYSTIITDVNNQPVNSVYAYGAALQSKVSNLPSNKTMTIVNLAQKSTGGLGQVMLAIERSGSGDCLYFRTMGGSPAAWSSWVKVANADGIVTDKTLSIADMPADAKATGDVINDVKADLSEIDDTVYLAKNIWDGTVLHGVRAAASGTKLQYYNEATTGARYYTAKIKIRPNTNYTVVRETSSYLAILTSSQNINIADFFVANPITPENSNTVRVVSTSVPTYVNFTSDANAEFLYVCYTIAGESTKLAVYEGTYTDFQGTAFYTREETDAIIGNVKSEFKTNLNIWDGAVFMGVRAVASGTKLQYYGNTTYRTAKVKINPNTKYSIVRNNSSVLFAITSSQNIDIYDFASQNSITPENGNTVIAVASTSPKYVIFTSDSNADYLYINYTQSGEDSRLAVYEGEYTDFADYIFYTKEETDALMERFSNKPFTIKSDANNVYVYFNIKDNYYGGITINHNVDHSDSIYSDCWRITTGALYTSSDGENFDSAGKSLLVGAENEMAINFRDMGDFTGGWHGDERIDIADGCYCLFVVDGQEYTISQLVEFGTIKCSSFDYRQVSELYASYSYNTEHFPIAKHTKITSFNNDGFATKNYIGIDLSEFDQQTLSLITSFTGLFCVASDFANYAVSDIGTIYAGSHPSASTYLAQDMNRYDRTAKTYNGKYSCEIDSRLINTNVSDIKNPIVDVDIMDRVGDLKYYSYLPTATLNDGDFLATEAIIRFAVGI